MTHAIKIEEPKTIPEARCNPAGKLNLDAAQRVRDLAEQSVQIWLRRKSRVAQPLHLTQSAFERLGFHRLQ